VHFAIKEYKITAEIDEMAVGAVYCEPVSRRIPVNREKYREFSRGSGRPRSVSPVKTACLSISNTSGSIQNREFRRAYQGIFSSIRILIRDSPTTSKFS
jgi:hypothetical protein